MYSEFLGVGYHEKIRKMLVLPKDVLQDSVIDAPLNINAMRSIIGKSLDKNDITNEQEFEQLASAAVYYLAGILCMAMKSRTSSLPFTKYKKNWDKKRKSYMENGNRIVLGLRKNDRKAI